MSFAGHQSPVNFRLVPCVDLSVTIPIPDSLVDDEQRMTVPVLGCEQKYRFLRASTSIRNTFRGLGCRHGGQESIWCGKYISSIVPPYAIPILFGLVL